MKRALFSISVIGTVLLTLIAPFSVDAAFNHNNLMSDQIFNNSGTMSSAQIDAFLNSFPSSCISPNRGFVSPQLDGYNPTEGFKYGPNVTAGAVIASAAAAYDLNPQVLLATLQKEQSLVSGSAGCHYETPPTQTCTGSDMPYGQYSSCVTACQYAGGCVYVAMGYDCPYYCVPNSTGFSKQIVKAAWKLKFVQQRSLGNFNWNIQKPGWDNSDDPLTSYSGYMTQGVLKRDPGSPYVSYDGYRPVNNNTISVHLDTGATASLYSYTPFTSGNSSFVSIFEGWFGSTQDYSCTGGINVPGVGTGVRVMPARPTWGADNLALVQINDTATACIEYHGWSDSNFWGWSRHTATNRHSITPADARTITADINGDGFDELIVVEYRNTSSGRIEMHTFTSDYQHWASHIASNRPSADPTDSEVIAADTNGDGRDELHLIDYRNTASGMIEVHTWSSNFQQWISHTATNRPAIDPANAEVIGADTNGDVRDELYLVEYRGTGSGMIEVHGWSAGLQSWASHTATNRPAIDPGTRQAPFAEVISADINGNLAQEFILVEYANTGSGRVEIHGWNGNLQQWIYHRATSQGSY